MSRRPGIGSSWFDRFASDCFPSDFLTHDGRKVPVPTYYYKKFVALAGEEAGEKIKRARQKRALVYKDDQTVDRLAVKEEVFVSRIKLLKRNLEDE